MPKKPKHPCSFPSCPKLTHERYCTEHKKQTDAQYNKYQRDPDTAKRYGSNWRRIRTAFIKARPLCELCQQKDKLTPAQEVHHIIPLSDGGTHAEENLMSLCTPCHSEITAREGGRWG